MKILALDTATELCSAALWIDGASLTRECGRPRGSGELILGMVAELLAELLPDASAWRSALTSAGIKPPPVQ